MGILTAIRPQQKGESPRFKNNRLSAVLREDHPNCLRQMVWPPFICPPLHTGCLKTKISNGI